MPLNRKIAYVDLTTGNIEIKPISLEIRTADYKITHKTFTCPEFFPADLVA